MRFKEIDKTDGKYLVSEEGYVYSVNSDGKAKKIVLDTSNGSARVYIKGHRVSVSRLVAEAFIPNNYPLANVVGHKDGNKLNNRADNLEWTTLSDLRRKKSEIQI